MYGQCFHHGPFLEMTGIKGLFAVLIGSLSPLFGICKDIMNQQIPTRHEALCPAWLILFSGFTGMAPINEHQAQDACAATSDLHTIGTIVSSGLFQYFFTVLSE
jgi:hypothetical protein